MKNKKIAALLGILLAGSMAFSLSACGNSNDSASDAKSDTSTSDTTDKSSDSSADDSNGAGFEEIQVDEKHSDQDVDALTVNAVYFQPIDMELKAADASFHLEADIHANEKGTELGYGKGDFVPDLTVNYEIINNANNETVGSGTFMQMNASDGPHYGANVKLDEAGSYKLVLKIESPEKKGWMLHVDPETGVKGRFWTEPLEVTFPEWNYTPQEW